MDNYSFDNNMQLEKAGTKLSSINGFVAYNDGSPAAFIKDNEGNIIRFDEDGFVFYDSHYDDKISVEQYCVDNDLELIQILIGDSNYHVSCTIN